MKHKLKQILIWILGSYYKMRIICLGGHYGKGFKVLPDLRISQFKVGRNVSFGNNCVIKINVGGGMPYWG